METNGTNRILITVCDSVQGDLYRVLGEDEYRYCYDWVFRAYTLDGRIFEHRTYSVKGASFSRDEGFYRVNFAARAQAETFAFRVTGRGSIDPGLWEEVSSKTFDLETALAEEAVHERIERASTCG